MADTPDNEKEHRWWIRIYDLVRRFTGWLWRAIIVAILVSGVVAWAFTPWKTDFSRYPVGTAIAWMQDHYLVLLAGGIGLVSLLMLLALLRQRTGRVERRPQAIPMTQEDRRHLLVRLRSLYQDTVKQSIWGMPRVELGLERTFEATDHPALAVSYRPAGIREAIVPSTSILDVYKAAGDGLLILGKPGAGKSTLLYDLALALAEQAEHNATQLPPALVSLNSWAEKRLPLEQWLAEELQTKYQIQHTLAIGWLIADQLLPLLDGLDEMAKEARSACIDAINTYRQDHPLPIVVSCRSEEYLSQAHKFHLQSAIEVQPLTTQQVQHYLVAGKRSLGAVRAALDQNPILQELLTTPLLLSVVTLAYRGKAKKDLPQMGTAEEQQRQVFRYYLQRMLERPVARGRFTPEQTRCWLTWLAQQMQQHQFTEFYLERLQPAWLTNKRYKAIYGLVTGLFLGLLSGLILGLAYGLAMGLVYGLSVGLISGLISGVVIGLIFGLIGGLIREDRIQLAEVPVWSWNSFLKGLRSTLRHWLAPSLIVALSSLLVVKSLTGLFILLGIYLGIYLIIGFVGGLFLGLSSKEIQDRVQFTPNQGIRNSGWNALRVGIICMLIVGLTAGLLFGPLVGLTSGLSNGFRFGLVIGLFFGPIAGLGFGLGNGGVTFLKHYILRFMLWRTTAIPWHYVRFLEEATIRILLQHVGGGYRFIHPLFQEYFASGVEATSPVVVPSSPPMP